MGIFKGGALRLFQSFLYLIEFCCAAIILGIYSYFLSVLADRNDKISNQNRAVEGLSGVAVIYTIFAVLLTCCLGGVSFFAFLGLVLDILFVGAFIAIAYFTREGAHSCKGYVSTPLGSGQANSGSGSFNGDITYKVDYKNACRLNTACFAVAIIGAFLFLITALMQIALVRNHKKEKRYGPSPANNYTSGYGGRKWGRKNKNAEKDAELGAVGAGVPAATLAADHHHDMRPSHDTAMTGTTVNAPATGGAYNKVDSDQHHLQHDHAPHANPTHGGYYTQPQGTGVNPYGYESNTASTGQPDNFMPGTTRYEPGTATNY